MNNLIANRFFSAGLALLLFCSPLQGDQQTIISENENLVKQLKVIANFNSTQNFGSSLTGSEIINRFAAEVVQTDSMDSAIFADSLSDFCELAFQKEEEASTAAFMALQISGRAQFFRQSQKTVTSAEKHFSQHVIDAIKVNRERKDYYVKVSGGETRELTRLYLALEYSILPVAAIMDAWAGKYQKLGLPVLINDFVSMESIAAPDQMLARNGSLDKIGLKVFDSILSAYNHESSAAARNKDFAMVQFYAIKALSDLRKLEKAQNCNLSMSIHLIESAGLAARNAAALSRASNGRTDNFYRAFIILQNVGLKGFARIDKKAQKFHQAGIGIITNDLPAIPFP